MAEAADTNKKRRAKSANAVGRTSLQPSCSCRIALYDDPTSSPQVIEVSPQETKAYLDEVTQKTISALREFNSEIPFMVVRECVENLIHAHFQTPTISILNKGKMIRFSDQGPGIQKKEEALEFGTTTATEEMKAYIRGVGSGLPIASQYMQGKGGYLSVEDNLNAGCVITLGFTEKPHSKNVDPPTKAQLKAHNDAPTNTQPQTSQNIQNEYGTDSYQLHEKEKQAILLCMTREKVGPTDLANLFGHSLSTWTRTLQYLVDEGLLKKPSHQQKYFLTTLGKKYATHYI